MVVLAFIVWKMGRQGFNSGSTTVVLQTEGYPGQLMNNEKVPLQAESWQFTYAELEKITKNFQRQIGKGGFGTVYHGYLDNGTQVAVKLHSQSSSQGSNELMTEMQWQCVITREVKVKESHIGRGKAATPGVLCWEERLRIALETAQGLEYLHNGCRPPIIHRDVKATNILFNEKLEAKIADFGLSKPCHNDTFTHVSTRVIGTAGYLDPEYYLTSQLTEKSDVYSFGVVLLELITGQPAILQKPDQCHISQLVQQWLSVGNIAHLVDFRLKGEFDANSVWKVVDIAMKCIAANSIQRPTMASVVVQLKEAMALEGGQDRNPDVSMEVCYTSERRSFEIDYGGKITVTGPTAR